MVIDFDLSPIPEDADIEEATFSMFFFYGDIAIEGRPNVCSLFTISKQWVDTEVTWNNADKDTKWEMLDPDTKFYNPDIDDTVSTPGGGDYNTSCVAVVDYTELNTLEHYDVTEAIKDVVENAKPFYGFLTKQFLCPKGSNYTNNGRVYHSSEYDVVEKRPKLTVKYTSTGINTQLLNNTKNNIRLIRRGEKITVFVPGAKTYALTVFNLQGEELISLKSCNTCRTDIPANYLSSGLNVVVVTHDRKNVSIKLPVIK